jgi:hypothetical protein
MTSKTDYTDEEWARLRRAPFVTGLAITIADPGGPIEMAKESVAALKAASTPRSQEELPVAVSQDIVSMMNQRQKSHRRLQTREFGIGRQVGSR